MIETNSLEQMRAVARLCDYIEDRCPGIDIDKDDEGGGSMAFVLQFQNSATVHVSSHRMSLIGESGKYDYDGSGTFETLEHFAGRVIQDVEAVHEEYEERYRRWFGD